MSNSTTTTPGYFEFTRQSDETITIDVRPLLIQSGAASSPTSAATNLTNGAGVGTLHSPSIASNIISQRILGSLFTADTVYLFRFTFTTSGQVRPVTVVGKCVG